MLASEDFLNHTRFYRARDTHIDALTSLFAGDRFVTWMMADAAVICMRAFIVGFHVNYAAEDRSTWATPTNLRQRIVELNLASPRRVDSMIARFRQAGYVEGRVPSVDRRAHLLIPTARLLAHDRDHLVAYHRFLLEIFPGQGYEWILSDDRESHFAIRRIALRNLSEALAFSRHAPIMMFLMRSAGYLAFLLLANAHIAGRERELTFTSIAAALGVSRTHIRNLFREAEMAGYVRLHVRGTRVSEITSPLWSSYDRFLADVQLGQHRIAQAAFAARL